MECSQYGSGILELWRNVIEKLERLIDPHPPVRNAEEEARAKPFMDTLDAFLRRVDSEDEPVRSYQHLLEHLATLTRNDIRCGSDPARPTVHTLTKATDEPSNCSAPVSP